MRRRKLSEECAERAIREDNAHGSMMLSNVARQRKEETARPCREANAARKRERRLRDNAREERGAIRGREDLQEQVRAHVEDMLNEPPLECPVCGAINCTCHPDEVDGVAER